MKFEYTRTQMRGEEEMNALGRDGWELVAVVQPFLPSGSGGYPESALMFWKRPVEEVPPLPREGREGYS